MVGWIVPNEPLDVDKDLDELLQDCPDDPKLGLE